MKTRMFDDFRGLFTGTHKFGGQQAMVEQGDVYVIHLVERLNYCRLHPKSAKCQ